MWELLLLNQFHDILPGSSIKEVYDTTQEDYNYILNKAEDLTAERISVISRQIPGDVILLNTLSFERDDIVIIDSNDAGLPDSAGISYTAMVDESGNEYLLQKTSDGKYVTFVEGIPAKGIKAFDFTKPENSWVNSLQITDYGIETPYYSVKVDNHGCIASLYDKDNGREVLKGKGNVLRVYEDKPMKFDNWDIDIYYTEKSWPVEDTVRCEWIEKGPVRAVLLVEHMFVKSLIRQKIYFYADSRRIDFDTYIDWHQQQHLVKVEFPVDVNAAEATCDIQFGNLKRPTHRNTSWDMAKFEVCAHKWVDLSEGGYGVSLLNDCKYGYSLHDGNIALTLLKSGIEPNPEADLGEHYMVYSLLPHSGTWQEGNTAEQAYMLNVPVYTHLSTDAAECKSGSSDAKSGSLLKVTGDNVILETVKKAEDRQGTIVRLYEYKNTRSKTAVEWFGGLSKVYECDLMENNLAEIEKQGNRFEFIVKPYEIKTFRLV